jgi:hypothetical protein
MKFKRMPTINDVLAARQLFDGVEYPDETFNYTEDWSDELGEFPVNPMAVLVFDPTKVAICRELTAESLLSVNSPATVHPLNEPEPDNGFEPGM